VRLAGVPNIVAQSFRFSKLCGFLVNPLEKPQTSNSTKSALTVATSYQLRNGSLQRQQAPEERQNLAHGASRGFDAHSPHPNPLPAGEGEPRSGGGGLRSQGLRPGLKSSAPGGAIEPDAPAGADPGFWGLRFPEGTSVRRCERLASRGWRRH